MATPTPVPTTTAISPSDETAKLIQTKETELKTLDAALIDAKAGRGKHQPPTGLTGAGAAEAIATASAERSAEIRKLTTAVTELSQEIGILKLQHRNQKSEENRKTHEPLFDNHKNSYNNAIAQLNAAWEAMRKIATDCPELVDVTFPKGATLETLIKAKGLVLCKKENNLYKI